MRGRWEVRLAIPGIVLAFSAGVRAQSCEPAAASVISVQGDVDVSDSDRAHWRNVQLNQLLCAGQQLRLMAKSRAVLRLPNETLIHLDEGSVFRLRAIEPDKPAWLDLLRGAVHIISRVPRALNIRTPFVNAGIEGTEFALRVQKEETALWVYEGRVRFNNKLGQLLIASGEAAIAPQGQAPQRRIVVKPRQAVEWALYYPPLLDSRSESYPEALRPAVLAYRRNDFTTAFAALNGVPEGARDARYHTLRAGFLLSVGRIPEAEGDLRSAERLDPKNGTAYALRSVIAVVRNEGDEALKLAEEAVRLAPGSATPYVARSYAEQSAFEIESARESLEKATELAPEDALVWARLAEIELSLGDLDAALAVARKAEQLDPGLSRTQSVLGFAYITRIEVDRAKTAFDRALALDPTDPLPRLGMGLARIRDGDLDAGTKEIETAASLDPNNSLVRSYLGKAYYEQKRGGLASTEIEQAKLLGPNDPTPWFYDAIRKQTTNRPVEALHDLERAIEFNDNRAVYRSRLLLDKDRAVRSTSLARIYHDLGFDKRALVEASKSLSLDPTDYSAHRFLSDTYAGLPRHQIARVSELLQAQLLQPININPVQPQLNETNLNIVTGAGPGRANFNEYSRLFERNRPQLILSGFSGNKNTFGDEAVLSGVHDTVSYSFGQFHYETDGFREKADVQHDVYNAFTQLALTDKINVQFEYRRRETDQGDIRLNLDPEFIPVEKRGLQQDVGRAGLHISASPSSDFIASLIYTDRQESLETLLFTPDSGTQDNRDNRHGYAAEGQYLFRGNWLDLTVGGGNYEIDVSRREIFFGTPETCAASEEPLGCSTEPDIRTFRIEQHNVYAYTNLLFPKNLTWTIGLSYDSYDEESIKLNKVNPKVGLQWNVTDRLRLRAAFLRTLKRQLLVDQTIEPTQVAGFNQFFDDFNGTRTEIFGIGLDAILTDTLYGGVEASRRNLVVPFKIALPDGSTTVSIDDQNDDRYRAYLYWTPYSNWALSAEYLFEGDATSAKTVETNSVPLAIRHFRPTGAFAEFGATFVWQDVDQQPAGSLSHKSEDFAVFDAAIGYRLPKRFGIVSLEARNLFDKQFLFQDLSFKTSDQIGISPRFIPDRTILFQVTLNF